ncbi:hypothetical protein HKX48_008264 [Thoreauomyces humboldtii]|nr:hypothetical protein HKX48_008264 [Thoreauomyces humboldtii]
MVRPGRGGANPYSSSAVQAASLTDTPSDLALPSSPYTVEQITRILAGRLGAGQTATHVGARCVLSLQSGKGALDLNRSKDYAEAYKTDPATFSPESALPAHVFDTAASAYRHMVRNQEDQCIILSGETGSGKSQSHRFITRHLCDLSKTSSKKSKVHSAVLKVDPVLSAFGNAHTPFNTDATCCTRYSEYQFDKRGKMMGLKVIEYLLEKSRVSGAQDGGRSFHIFYHLLAGATQEEKMQMHLSDPAHFHYLSQSSLRSSAADSGTALDDVRDNLKALGVGRRQQAQLWQLLAAILHLGNVTFHDDAHNVQEACTVRNYAQLELVASLLGLHPSAMEGVLTYRTKLVGRDITTVFLDSEAAEKQRDSLACALYSVLFSWVVEQINDKLCQDESVWSSFVSVLDVPGFAGQNIAGHGFHRLLVNFENERLRSFLDEQLFDLPRDSFTAEGLSAATSSGVNNIGVLAVLNGPKGGLLSIIDKEAARGSKDAKITEKIYAAQAEKTENSAFISSKKPKYAFGIRHYAGVVEYDTHGFSDCDADILQSDFVTLVRGSPEQPGTGNVFLRTMFSDRLVATQTSKRDGKTLIAATSKGRNPSMRGRRNKKSVEDEQHVDASDTIGHQFRTAFAELLPTLQDSQTWFVLHLKINDDTTSRSVDQDIIRNQVSYYDLPNLCSNPAVVYTAALPHADFLKRYASVIDSSGGDNRRQCEGVIASHKWTSNEAVNGSTRVFLAEGTWKSLEYRLAALEVTSLDTPTYAPSEISHDDHAFDDNASHFESEFDFDREPRKSGSQATLLKNDMEMGSVASDKRRSAFGTPVAVREVAAMKEPKPKRKMTGSRCRWLTCTWASTWCFPPCCLWLCGMKLRDRQLAWREKVALCLVIIGMNLVVLFFIVGLSFVLCPTQAVKSPGEISGETGLNGKGLVFMYGSYYALTTTEIESTNHVPASTAGFWSSEVMGQDVSQMFPILSKNNPALDTRFATLCPGYTAPAAYYQFATTDDKVTKGTWMEHAVADQTKLSAFRKGTVVWTPSALAAAGTYITAYDKIYDVGSFSRLEYTESLGVGATSTNIWLDTPNTENFMTTIVSTFANSGDATSQLNSLRAQRPADYAQIMTCMNNMFYVGKVDHRNDLKCRIPNYAMLIASAVICAVIGFKFLAALQFGGKKNPEEHDKFIICQVPCYTEGEASLLRTLESLAVLDYDDKHKLLFVICDGNIVGSGNDRPTPRIVLDILGVDPSLDPDALSFQSLGDGNKQLNMAKVYSGLYEIQGKVVPYIVVVKVGKPSERARPGNRGKRDSQLVVMKFLSHVHYNQPMSPLELELYHQMKNVIGVDPSFYEYVFTVDADTDVYKDSLNRLVSQMARDSKIIGLCGETQIANERDSWVSMIQVYEYFISHNMAKAFESLFGSVTCLPGCFSMYRVRTPVKNLPLLIAPALVNDYSQNVVDTLHLKNLLHLGEDRYLTTLLLKHFPNMKTAFTSDAKCRTNAPDSWSVLLSQRRRWINSTVHNLLELVWLPQMCGFCCFSMRFVVFIDLMATFVQPAALVYIVYLVYTLVANPDTQFPLISIVMIAIIYGFQMVIFIAKREWQHIGWMVIYILAMPLFGAFIPLYSFWHFDDFSWGDTRRVDEGGKVVEKPMVEEDFDPESIPLRLWSEFEPERIAADEDHSRDSYHSGSAGSSGQSRGVPATAYGGSQYGGSQYGGTHYGAGSAYGGGSQYGGMASPQHDGYNARMSWGTQYTGGLPDYSGMPPPPSSVGSGAAGGLGRRQSQRSTYTATSDAAPRALPSDDEILRQVRHILSTADLMSVTKKSVREELSTFFGVDLGAKKEWIHRCIDGVLKGEL